MLAAQVPEDLEQLRFPLLASAKLDGIRCLIRDGKALSRTLKPIRNHFVQSILAHPKYAGLDGELIVGSPTAPNCMQATTSGVMTYEGEPDFHYHVFDHWNRQQQPFQDTVDNMLLSHYRDNYVKVHPQTQVANVTQLENFESACLSAGYEGVITRAPEAPYKFNRSTTKQQWMLKLKRYAQDEAVVVGSVELVHDEGQPTIDARGYMVRSDVQANKVPSDKLGALVCRQLFPGPGGSPTFSRGPEFKIGTGFDDFQRRLLWQDRETLPGRIVTFKHFAQTGVKDKPRHPVFIAFRAPEDL